MSPVLAASAAEPFERPPTDAAFGFRFVAPLALGATLNPINSTMIATALAPIAADFHASVAQAGWLIAGLYLASAIAQPTMGRLADLLGPRRVYLCALVLVAAAGVVGRLAPSLPWLVFARVLLGIGTSGAYPAAMRIFRTQADRLGCKPPRAAMSFLSLAAISTAAVGLLLGGVLTSAFGWHAIFTINIPLAMFTAVMVLAWTPRDPTRPQGAGRLLGELDLIGIGLFAAFLLSLMVFVMNLARPIWPALPAAAILGVALAWHSARRDQPFIDVRMLARNHGLSLTYLRAGLLALIIYAMIYALAQWLESALGFSSAKAGLVMAPLSMVAAVSSVIGGRTRGIRGPLILSIAVALAGCAWLALVGPGTSAWLIAAAIGLFGLGQGMFSTSTQAAVYIQAPASEIGAAAGLQRTAQYVGAIAAASLLGLVYGQRATDAGFHHIVLMMGVLTAGLLVFTVFDRTLPRGAVG